MKYATLSFFLSISVALYAQVTNIDYAKDAERLEMEIRQTNNLQLINDIQNLLHW